MGRVIKSMQGDMETARGPRRAFQAMPGPHLARAPGDPLCRSLIRKDGQKHAGDRLLFKGGGHIRKQKRVIHKQHR